MTHAPIASVSDEDVISRIETTYEGSGDSLAMFLLLPAVAMSLGWALRGTIGGSSLGAMIPGAIVTLCLCHLLRWKSEIGIVAAIGTVGIGLGGQETYGQTIGFLREPSTVLWGLSGLTIKGAMWGLSGGVLVGLAFMHSKYRWWQIAIGLVLMVAVTILGREYIDEPKYVYFSNRVGTPKDPPRREIWVGLTLGAAALLLYLNMLRKEKLSSVFALGGMVAGAVGFGGGSLFLALGNTLPDPYRGWPWWKMMEFTFGALYGLGLGAIGYSLRNSLRETDDAMARVAHFDLLKKAPVVLMILLGFAVSMWVLLSMGEIGPRPAGGGRDGTASTARPSEIKATDAQRSASTPESTPKPAAQDANNKAREDNADANSNSLQVWRNLRFWTSPTFDYRIESLYSVIAAELILLSLLSNRLAWHVVLGVTICAFLRDFLHGGVEREWFSAEYDDWRYALLLSIVPVAVVSLAERRGRLTAPAAILGLAWFATLFGATKLGIPRNRHPSTFVVSLFIIELLVVTVLVLITTQKRPHAVEDNSHSQS